MRVLNLIIILTCIWASMNAQKYTRYTDTSSCNSCSDLSILLPDLSTDPRYTIRSVDLFAKVKFTNNRSIYQNPLNNANGNFIFDGENKNFNIGGNKAEQVFKKPIGIYSGPVQKSLVNLYSNPDVTWELIAAIDYSIQPSNNTVITDFYQVEDGNGRSKDAVIKWASDFNHGYQLQVIKLVNEDEIYGDNESPIKVVLDDEWQNALTFNLENETDSLKFTIAEGSGFYLARIRPIGSVHPGGFSDFRNYGLWDVAYDNNSFTTFDSSALTPQALYFMDPDSLINWSFNRVFTENNHIKQVYTIADPLLNVRQTQTYLPSKNIKLIAEPQLDFSGRASLNSITIPIVENSGLQFKPQFMKATGTSDTIFRPEFFDTDAKLLTPDKVDDTELGFDYYSTSNPDQRIPSAIGYQYSRQLFENDGTGRVKEQSAPGPIMNLSPNRNDTEGRTIKTYYGTATESELIRIFGDEAPRSTSVNKVLTIDQNNVGSIQYIGSDEKILATALVEDPMGYLASNLLPLNHVTGSTNFIHLDSLNFSLKTDDGMLSSKRFIVSQPTPFTYSYTLYCNEFEEPCADVEVDCKWDVIVNLYKVDDVSFVTKRDTYELHTQICTNGKKEINLSAAINLTPGTYIIEKLLIQAIPAEAQLKNAEEAISKQIYPLTTIVQDKLKAICTQADVDAFYIFLTNLSSALNNIASTAIGPVIDVDFNADYDLPQEFEVLSEHQMIYDPSTQNLLIKSKCCDQILLDVAFIPAFKCPDSYSLVGRDANGNGILDVNTNFLNSEWPVDFEGYALNYLQQKCLLLSDETYIYNNLMKGWAKGEFNWMVYHMLTDQYNCNGPSYNENPSTTGSPVPPSGDCLSDGIEGLGNICNGTACTQYTCEELFQCWQGIIHTFADVACGNLDSLLVNTRKDKTITEGAENEYEDEEPTADGAEEHDSHFDDNISGFMKFVLWITGASGKIRDAQNGDFQTSSGASWGEKTLMDNTHFVKEFLECAGYKFAEIVDLNATTSALITDAAAHNTMLTQNVFNNTQAILPLTGLACSGGFAFDCWSPLDQFNPDVKMFRFIPNNIFAFKYFYYSGNGGDVGLKGIEIQTCYNDPNFYKDAAGYTFSYCPTMPDGKCEFCELGIINCDETHEEWSCGQRYTFYELIKNYIPPSPSYQTPTPEYVDCSDDGVIDSVFQVMEQMKGSCEANCEFKRGIFRAELVRVLTERCYNVGECRGTSETANVPWKDVDQMVDQLVNQCKNQCNLNTFACLDDINCIEIKDAYNLSAPIVQRDKILIGVGGMSTDACSSVSNTDGTITMLNCTNSGSFSYCDLTEWEQAYNWKLEIEIESQCDPGDPGYQQLFNCTTTTDHFCVERIINNQVYSLYGQQTAVAPVSSGVKVLSVNAN